MQSVAARTLTGFLFQQDANFYRKFVILLTSARNNTNDNSDTDTNAETVFVNDVLCVSSKN